MSLGCKLMVHSDLARTQLPNWFSDCLDGCVEPTWGGTRGPSFRPQSPPPSLFSVPFVT